MMPCAGKPGRPRASSAVSLAPKQAKVPRPLHEARMYDAAGSPGANHRYPQVIKYRVRRVCTKLSSSVASTPVVPRLAFTTRWCRGPIRLGRAPPAVWPL